MRLLLVIAVLVASGDSLRAQRAPAESPGTPRAPVESDLRISLFFGGGSYYLHPAEDARLRDFLDAHPRIDAYGIEIQGHTDDIGDRAYNLRLSAARAEVVRQRLLAYPVPPGAIEVLPLGEDAPVFDNATWEGKLSNRRVDVIIKPVLL